MATITSIKGGNWGTAGTWDSGVPVNGDTVIIEEGHSVIFNVDQSGFANGLAGLIINGALSFNYNINTCLKMNGNISGTGQLIVGHIVGTNTFTLAEGFTYTYTKNIGIRIVDVIQSDFLNNYAFPYADKPYIKCNSIEEVESTPGSWYQNPQTLDIYIHYHDNHVPNDKKGTIIVEINRPAVGSEYWAYILFNSSGTINVPTIRMYGWYPEKEYTQLSADAALNDTTIVLKEDLGLQAGDTIAIGLKNTYGAIGDANKGLYTVQSYNGGTKTVTLTTGLQSARFTDDYVAIYSRPIKIIRSSGTKQLLGTTVINNVILKGVNLSVYLGGVPGTFAQNWLISHCSTNAPAFLYFCQNSILEHSIMGNTSANVPLQNCLDSQINNCIIISAHNWLKSSVNVKINNCVGQNMSATLVYYGDHVFKNSIFKSFRAIGGEGATFINCIFDTEESIDYVNQVLTCISCTFKNNTSGYFLNVTPKLINCLFEGTTEITNYLTHRGKQCNSESFDHNQIPGNYMAWMKGGTIETDTDGLGDPIPGHLIFTCESADYPVFRDFPMLLAAYKTNRWQALANKSFTGGEVKIELIDPTSDPLIDSEATPLASYSLPDQADTNLPLKLGYKSDKAMQAILRISATNSEGTVEVDSRLIENRVQHG